MIFCIYFSEFLWKYNLRFNALSRFSKLLFYFQLNLFRLVGQKGLITALIHSFQRLLSWTTFLKNCRSWSFSFMTSTVLLVMSNQQISWEKWNVRWGRYEISYILLMHHHLFWGIEEYYDKQYSDGCSQLSERLILE